MTHTAALSLLPVLQLLCLLKEHQRLCTQAQHMSGSSVEVVCGLQCTCRGRLGRSSVPARSCVDSWGTDAQACVICAPGPPAVGDAPSRSPLHLPSAGWDDSRRIVSPGQQNSTCAGLLLRQRHALGAHQRLALQDCQSSHLAGNAELYRYIRYIGWSRTRGRTCSRWQRREVLLSCCHPIGLPCLLPLLSCRQKVLLQMWRRALQRGRRRMLLMCRPCGRSRYL
jgi:hypothetical protein